MERIEDDWGAWGALYRDDDGRLLGSIQYGPATLFPRAAELPAGPPSDDAVLVTCVYVVSTSTPWVEQSLFLAAIGDARDKGAKALEAFAYRYPEGESTYERFLVHRTVFPRDFLADFGFRPVRAQGRVELSRLELGGLVPVVEGKRARRAAGREGGLRARAGAAGPVTASPSRRSVVDSPDVSRSHLRQLARHHSQRHPHRPSRSLQLPRSCNPPRRRDPDRRRCAPERVHGHPRRERREPDLPGVHAGRPAARHDPVRRGAGRSRTASLLADPGARPRGRRSARPTRWGCSARRSTPRSPRTASSTSTTRGPSRGTLRQPRLALHDVRRRRSAPATELVLVDEIPRRRGNHNGGDLRFGNDGFLYVSVGDGGCDYAGNSGCAGQNDASRDQHVLVGKILRITEHRRHPGRRTPSRAPARRAATSPAGRPPATSARRPSPGACATRSGSRSTPTPPARASSSTTSARTSGRRSTSGRPAPTTAGTSARGPAPTARTTNCGPPPAGMTNPIYAYGHDESGVRGDHRRRLRPERHLARRRTTAPTSSATTPAARSSSSSPNGSGGFTRTEFATGVGAVVNMTFGPSAQRSGALLHELLERRRGAPDRADASPPTGRRRRG